MDNFKGYSLFNDIENKELQVRNRAVVMANIFADNPDISDRNSTSKAGASLIFGYMGSIVEEDRPGLVVEFHKQMKERGYKHVG